MASYEIFSNPSYLYTTLFALICLLFSAICSIKEKNLTTAVILLMIALIFDLLAAHASASALHYYNLGQMVATKVMMELLFMAVALTFMSLSASHFISSSVISAASLPAWILGGAGIVSAVLYTIVWPDNDIINNMRFIFSLAGLLYLCVGFAARFSYHYKKGFILAFALSTTFIVLLLLKQFFLMDIPWFFTPAAYIVLSLSFLLMKSDCLLDKIKQFKKTIAGSTGQLEAIIKSSPFPIIMTRLSDDRIILANNNAIKLFGLQSLEEEVYCFKDFFADSDNRRLLLEYIEEHKEAQDFEVLIKTPVSETPFWLLTSAKIIDYKYDVILYLAFQDITGRKSREALLQNQATRDPLTSLYNRRYFEEEVKKEILKAKSQKTPYSLLMLDADHFKNINDTYGHKIGDKVLIELAAKCERALRDKDIIARFGGEEFVIFLPDITIAQAQKVADRLRQSISSIVVYSDEGKPIQFTVSIGVTSSDISDDIDMLIKTADDALYKAKETGRNKVEIFESSNLSDFVNQADTNKLVRDNMHPAFNNQNTAEISLIDGTDTQIPCAPSKE